MPVYTILLTVSLYAESEHEAYGYVKQAIRSSKQADIEYLDAEVTHTDADVDEVIQP